MMLLERIWENLRKKEKLVPIAASRRGSAIGSFVSGQAGCALILKGITTGETLFWSMDINSRSWPLLFYPVHLADFRLSP